MSATATTSTPPTSTNTGNGLPPRLLRLPDVLDRTGLSRSGVYELMEAGRFPRRVHLSARAIAFVESEVDLWCAERIAARDADVAA